VKHGGGGGRGRPPSGLGCALRLGELLEAPHEGSAEDGDLLGAEGLDGEGEGRGVGDEGAGDVEVVDDPRLGAGEVAEAEGAVVDRDAEALGH